MSNPLTEGKTRANVKKQDGNSIRPIAPPPPMKPMSKREQQWRDFSEAVASHLRDYTVPQYGDVGDDEITNYTVGDCVTHLSRYAKRYGTQSRAGQQKLDFMKIAHYAQCAWEKYDNEIVFQPKLFHIAFDGETETQYANLGYVWVGVTVDIEGNYINVYKEK